MWEQNDTPIYRLEGDRVWFGAYPQSRKGPEVRMTAQRDARGYARGDDGAMYAEVGGAYFKVEPLCWRVLSAENGRALLLCERILTAMPFAAQSNNYAQSEVRAWLNGSFAQTAFTAAERAVILTAQVDNGAESTGYDGNPYACENTEDRIFLPSAKEVRNTAWGFSASRIGDCARIRVPSDYAMANGACQSADGGGRWWLRSPENDRSRSARHVGLNGGLYDDYVFSTANGIVPALWILL